MPRQFNLYRLSEAGTLTGLEIPAQRNLKVFPYMLGQVNAAPIGPTLWLGDVGGDIKYSVTPSLTLDATVNTDFAQVEVDDLQINLVDGWIGKTRMPGRPGDDFAYKMGASYNSERWRLSSEYTEVQQNFNPEAGFLRRGAYRSGSILLFRTVRFGDNRFKLHEWRPHVNGRGIWGIEDGLHESGQWHIDQHLEWKNSTELHTGMNLTHEGVRRSFEISPGVFVAPGMYDHAEAQIVLRTNEGHWLSFSNTLTAGGFFGGDRVSLTPTVRLRAGDTFNAEIGINFNDVDLPWGSFHANLYRTRLSYSFTPRMYAQALVQYNSQVSLWSSNLRFGWTSDLTCCRLPQGRLVIEGG